MTGQYQPNTKIDFYYWSDQCPYNSIIKNLLNSLKKDSRYSINSYDISMEPKIAKELNMYSPTLLVFNNSLRWNGPISKETIDMISEGKIPTRKPYVVKNSDNLVTGTAIPLTEKTVLDTYKPCGCSEKSCCTEKAVWIKRMRDLFDIPHVGILHYLHGSCIGGAEFVPSLAVPYPIPKGEDIAFLTCSFFSDPNADYKSFPLQVLENELPNYGFESLMAIASEEVMFPNGTLEWFMERGYEDLGEVGYEERDAARMHLLRKNLRTRSISY